MSDIDSVVFYIFICSNHPIRLIFGSFPPVLYFPPFFGYLRSHTRCSLLLMVAG